MKIKIKLISALRIMLVCIGIVSSAMLVLSFTDLPYNAYHSLGFPESSLSKDPEVIIILGGAGMPSGDGLQRTYYGSVLANYYSKAAVVVVLPKSSNESDSLYQLELMKSELIKNRVSPNRIILSTDGSNTYEQSLSMASKYADLPALLVTSPQHSWRAVKTFQKSGFKQIGALPTFENPVSEADLKSRSLIKTPVHAVSLRYNMWSYLIYEIQVLREYAAISYYWIMGWI